MEPALLEVNDLHKHFGGIHAVAGTSFQVGKGEIYGLIGPNGSGKTTVFNLLTGFLRADNGSVKFRGQPILGLRPFQIARLGLIRTFQGSLHPSEMTVMENMLLAPGKQTGEGIVSAAVHFRRVRREEKRNLERAREILDRMGILKMADEFAGSLSGGQKKLLSLAQALMAAPELICLDEPVAGVNPRLIDDIVETIIALRDEGRASFLVVEHNMKVVRRMCDRLSVLDAGNTIASGTPAEVLAREDVLQAYLGGQVRTSEEETTTTAED